MTLSTKWLAAVLSVNHLAHYLFFFVEVHAVNQLQDCVSSHATFEVFPVTEFHFTVENFVFDDLT